MRNFFSFKHLLSALTATLVVLGTMVAVNAPAQAAPTETAVRAASDAQAAEPEAVELIGFDTNMRLRFVYNGGAVTGAWFKAGPTYLWLPPNYNSAQNVRIEFRLAGRPDGQILNYGNIVYGPNYIESIVWSGRWPNPEVSICYQRNACADD